MEATKILDLFHLRERQCRVERRALEMWLAVLTPLRWFTVMGGVVFSAVGGAAIFTKALGESATIVCGSFALLASILTALHAKLNCDAHQAECHRLINLYSSLEYAYQAARMLDPAELSEANAKLEHRFEEARANATASAPSRYRQRSEQEVPQ